MKTVGQILKESREGRFYTLEEVEKATKIRKELLVALEADDYNKLPPSTFVQGFIKNYAQFLGLSQDKLLAIFRREFADKRHRPYVMEAFAKPLKEGHFRITPAKFFGLVITLLVLSFFTYLWFQYRQFVGPPQLTLISPADQSTFDNTIIIVSGTTDPEVKVLINDQEVMVGIDGSFKEEVALSSPFNKINVVAISKFGQKNQIERMVYLKNRIP